MTVKDAIKILKTMPQDVRVLELAMPFMGNYSIVFIIDWMELQRKKLDD